MVLVAPVRNPSVALSVYPVPTRVTERSANVAIPPTAAWLSVPARVAGPVRAIVEVSPVTRLLNWSRTRTVTAGAIATPATVVVGCWTKARWSAAAGVTVNGSLTASGLRPGALAVSTLLPVVSIRRSEKATVPSPAAVPMSAVVVPWSTPVPLERVIVTISFAGRPTVEALPKASRDWSAGWTPNAAPAVAEPGWVVYTRWSAAAGVTVSS